MKLKNATLGTDPEMFLFDTQTQKFKSAIDIIPGTKELPFRPDELDNGFGLQTDNVLIEFNIPPVSIDRPDLFIQNINTMKQYIQMWLNKYDQNYTTRCQASAYLDESELIDERACMFGCDPDFNCYTKKQNPSPQIKEPTLRSAGFHWHIGFENLTAKSCINLIRYMDLFMGIPSIILDTDVKRRLLYGKAGAFRFQPYGVEWRVLSSYFLQDDTTIGFMYQQLMKAIKAFEDNVALPAPRIVVNTINKSDINTAKTLIDMFHIANELL